MNQEKLDETFCLNNYNFLGEGVDQMAEFDFSSIKNILLEKLRRYAPKKGNQECSQDIEHHRTYMYICIYI